MAELICGHNTENEQERQQLLAVRHKFELWQGWLLLVGIVMLIFCQAALYYDRSRISETWYGEDYTAEQVEVNTAFAASNRLWGSVTLALDEHSQLEAAKVLINGQEAGCFKEAELTLRVFEGNELTLDCSAYAQPIRLRISKTSYGIDNSYLLTDVVVCGDVVSLGKIVFE